MHAVCHSSCERLLVVVVLSFALSGCYFFGTPIPCASDDNCPSAMHCDLSAGTCAAGEASDDAGPRDDAGHRAEDAGAIDAGMTDAAVDAGNGDEDAGIDNDGGPLIDAGNDDAGDGDAGDDDAGAVDGGGVQVDCGNGAVDAIEQCDDGNVLEGDGCGRACRLEPGYDCDADGGASVCVVSENAPLLIERFGDLVSPQTSDAPGPVVEWVSENPGYAYTDGKLAVLDTDGDGVAQAAITLPFAIGHESVRARFTLFRSDAAASAELVLGAAADDFGSGLALLVGPANGSDTSLALFEAGPRIMGVSHPTPPLDLLTYVELHVRDGFAVATLSTGDYGSEGGDVWEAVEGVPSSLGSSNTLLQTEVGRTVRLIVRDANDRSRIDDLVIERIVDAPAVTPLLIDTFSREDGDVNSFAEVGGGGWDGAAGSPVIAAGAIACTAACAVTAGPVQDLGFDDVRARAAITLPASANAGDLHSARALFHADGTLGGLGFEVSRDDASLSLKLIRRDAGTPTIISQRSAPYDNNIARLVVELRLGGDDAVLVAREDSASRGLVVAGPVRAGGISGVPPSSEIRIELAPAISTASLRLDSLVVDRVTFDPAVVLLKDDFEREAIEGPQVPSPATWELMSLATLDQGALATSAPGIGGIRTSQGKSLDGDIRFRFRLTLPGAEAFASVRANQFSDSAFPSGFGFSLSEDGLVISSGVNAVRVVELDDVVHTVGAIDVDASVRGTTAVVTLREDDASGRRLRVVEAELGTPAEGHYLLAEVATPTTGGDSARLEELLVESAPFGSPGVLFFDTFSRPDDTTALGDAEYPASAWSASAIDLVSQAAFAADGVTATTVSAQREAADFSGLVVARAKVVLGKDGNSFDLTFNATGSIGVSVVLDRDAGVLSIKEGGNVIGQDPLLNFTVGATAPVFVELTVNEGLPTARLYSSGFGDGTPLMELTGTPLSTTPPSGTQVVLRLGQTPTPLGPGLSVDDVQILQLR